MATIRSLRTSILVTCFSMLGLGLALPSSPAPDPGGLDNAATRNFVGALKVVSRGLSVHPTTSIEQDVDRPGNDLRVVELTASNVAPCRRACEDEPLCRAYSFVPAGIEGPQARCHLKSIIPVSTKSRGVISGVRLTTERRLERGGAAFRTVAIAPGPTAASVCASLCGEDLRCRAYTAKDDGSAASCALKEQRGTGTICESCVSGYKPRAADRRDYVQEPAGGLKPPQAPPADGITTARQELGALRRTIWETSQIPVCWEEDETRFAKQRGWTRDEIQNTWEANSQVRFTGWGTCTDDSRGIRIRVADERPRTKGLGSDLDGREKGMTLNFEFKKWSCGLGDQFCIRAIAVHEFGHALGFAHEQNRSDAPPWCREEAQSSDPDIFMTPYDPQSIMNYCNPAWNNFGMLSDHDIAGLQFWYGPGPSARTPWTPDCRTDALLFDNSGLNGQRLRVSGTSAALSVDGFDNRTSSLCVPAGFRLVVYQGEQFTGSSRQFDGPVQSLVGGDWNNTISSVMMIDLATGTTVYDAPPECEYRRVLYGGTFFRGRSVPVDRQIDQLGQLNFNDMASSVCVPDGDHLVLWEDSCARGRRLDIDGPSFIQRLPTNWLNTVTTACAGRCSDAETSNATCVANQEDLCDPPKVICDCDGSPRCLPPLMCKKICQEP